MTCAADFTDAKVLAAVDRKTSEFPHFEYEETDNDKSSKCRWILPFENDKKLNRYGNYFYEKN